jgi:hypothetical protein
LPKPSSSPLGSDAGSPRSLNRQLTRDARIGRVGEVDHVEGSTS